MTHPIAMIPYANMAPFQQMGPPPECAFVRCTPRQSIDALRQKQVWAAAAPVGGLVALQDLVTPVGCCGIAAEKGCMSVLFFSDRPFEHFKRPLTLHLTHESASSVRLLRLLLGYCHGFDRLPYQARQNMSAHGELVIGDKALHWARQMARDGHVQNYSFVTDLAAQWYLKHQLPFVFARWVVHRNAPSSVKAALEDWLMEFTIRETDLIQQAAPKVAADLELPVTYVETYFKVVRRCLTENDFAGQERFIKELEKHAANPLFPEYES